MIPYYLLLAAGIVGLENSWQRGLALSLGTLIILPGVWFTYQTPQLHDWRVASAYVLDRAQPGDIVVFSPPWYKEPFDYYARGRVALFELTYPFVPEQICNEALKGHSRLWLIQPYDKHYTDPTNSLPTCLDARFDLIDTFRFPPKDGTIFLFRLSNQSHFEKR